MSNTINKAGSYFVCPYCIETSKLSQIQFSLSFPEDNLSTDAKLSEYWQQVLGDKSHISKSRAAIVSRSRGRGVKTAINKAGKRVPVAYVDENMNVSYNRVCPVCHNPLAPNTGFANTANILIVGDDSKRAFEYTKKLFSSLYRGNIIEQTDFYSPLSKVENALSTNRFDSISYEENRFLTGRLVYSYKNSLACEIAITYIPLGIDDLQNYNKITLRRFFSQSNGIIFVADYKELDPFHDTSSIGYIQGKSELDDYLLKITELIGNSGIANDAFPVAFVLSNMELAKACTDITHASPQMLGIYEADAVNNYTSNIFASIDNNTKLTVESLMRNVCYFSICDVNSSVNPMFQNPVKWIVQTYNLKEINKTTDNNQPNA